jgi:hypothetical protein
VRDWPGEPPGQSRFWRELRAARPPRFADDRVAQTARETQGSNVTVHFWLLGCTGLGISYGLTGPYQPFTVAPNFRRDLAGCPN